MKKLLLTSLVALGVVSNANAGAYVAGHLSTFTDSKKVVEGNTVTSKESFAKTLHFNAAAGYAFSNGFRLEADFLTVGLHKDKVDFDDYAHVDFGLHAVKGLYDVKLDGAVTPYFGVGASHVKFGKDRIDFGVIGVVGVSFAVNDQVSIDVQYNRTFDFDYSNAENDGRNHNGVNVFKIGGVFKF